MMPNALTSQGEIFAYRHIGPDDRQIEEILKTLELKSLDDISQVAIPKNIQLTKELDLPPAQSEAELLKKAREIASQNKVFKSYIGQGYYESFTPPVIQRNILENPGWYTAYTPYQAEISQGRMEALLNFQTMVMDLTAMDMANASLLDEGTAAAEAMTLCLNVCKRSKAHTIFVDQDCFPQTLEVLSNRAAPLGIHVQIGSLKDFDPSQEDYFAFFIQTPSNTGLLQDLTAYIDKAHRHNVLAIVATDLLSLCLTKPPGEMGADVVIGSSQRLGVPLGFGGPHAGFIATREAYKRQLPGRIIGISKDKEERPALRLALQTREQHIRREKATSNICTSQVLLAVMASMYAVYHGPQGLRQIANRVHRLTATLAEALNKVGFKTLHSEFFDTLCIETGGQTEAILNRAHQAQINLRRLNSQKLALSLNETSRLEDIDELLAVFSPENQLCAEDLLVPVEQYKFAHELLRSSSFLTHPVFNSHHSETKMLRYIYSLQSKDLSLTHSMIPLGSCTMKLNATTEMTPITWPEFASIHPFAPADQTQGYRKLIQQLEQWLCAITGFAAVSLQPNSGAQGEYAGLLVIRKYHESRGQSHRNICLIPSSAHGTNPASAHMAGMKIVVVQCDNHGNINMDDLKAKAEQHSENLAALMVTYPSTHGVFEETIDEICKLIHQHQGQVYMDGANMNAMVGLCQPGKIGADVCHLNLHKTFCIPHGGGGPGVGPIGVAQHLAAFLPTHTQVPECGPSTGIPAVSAAPWGSAGILPISWAYIAMMGSEGLKKASQVAILNANYIAQRLEDSYPILYRGKNGWVAHECIIDLRGFKDSAGITVDDVAKRLMDYGFHAPTMSWPVTGTLMIEPTESESKEELDRFCEAMIEIRQEIAEIEAGKVSRDNNVLKNAPHPLGNLLTSEWAYPYSREKAAYPLQWVREHKFWVSVSRVDNAYGDKNLMCSCLPVESEL